MKSVLQSISRMVVAVLSFTPFVASAQITVTSNDILGLIGKSQLFEEDTTGGVTVNVGSAGANQTWDFRNVVLQGDVFTYQFLAPQNTPFASDFPQSNFVQKLTSPSEPGSEAYVYLQVTSANFRSLGNGFVTPDTTLADLSEDQIAPLPLQFNATWNSSESDTFGDPQTFALITTITSNQTVDAWGTVRLAVGDFACLRIRDNSKTVSKTIISGMVFSADSTTSIDYAWISKNDYLVANASSQDGETNPNFTNASYFGRLGSTTTGVASRSDNASVPADFVLEQNFPNPFNPETRIAFNLSRAGFAELVVFNLKGERVRTLISSPISAGTHSATWDGRDEQGQILASGMYVYRLKAGNLARSRTMLLMK